MSDIITAANGKTPPVREGEKRKFSTEFKNQLVTRVKAGEAVQGVADEYGLSGSVLRRWMLGEGLGVVGSSNGSKKKMSAATKKKISQTRKKMFKKGLLTMKGNDNAKRKYVRVDESMHGLAKLPGPIKEAIGLLKLAQKWMYSALQTGHIGEFDEAHDLSRMALRELLKLKEK